MPPGAGSSVPPRSLDAGAENGLLSLYRMVTGVVLSGCVGTEATPRILGVDMVLYLVREIRFVGRKMCGYAICVQRPWLDCT